MKKLFLLIILFVPLLQANAQTLSEVQKIVASDRQLGDLFGYTVAHTDNYAIVGAPDEDENDLGTDFLTRSGSAYIYKRDAAGNWNQIQKIVASDRMAEARFGVSVSISGAYAIVGAQFDGLDSLGGNPITYAGSAYIFKRDSSGTWSQVQKITASDRGEGDAFGASVSINGNYAIVGAVYDEKNTSGGDSLHWAGSAYIFKRDINESWNQTQKIVASDRDVGDFFAIKVSISDSYLVVAAPQEDEDTTGNNTSDATGSAYIFERDAGENWNQVQKIVASDRSYHDGFANDVAISGDYIVVGASQEDEDEFGNNFEGEAGSAYLFERDLNGTWHETQKIVASDRDWQDFFGRAVAIRGQYLVVSAHWEDEDASGANTFDKSGSAYLFERDFSGNWNQIQKICSQR